MKKRLVETMAVAVLMDQHGMSDIEAHFHELLQATNCAAYGELSLLTAAAQFVYLVHQTNHWQAKADPFYGDHLMFERLYTGTLEDVDSLAERSIGMGDASNVNLTVRLSAVCDLVSKNEQVETIPRPSQLVDRSLTAELLFLNFAKFAANSLKERGMLSRGTDNLIQGIEDKHEGHVYLLKQRRDVS